MSIRRLTKGDLLTEEGIFKLLLVVLLFLLLMFNPEMGMIYLLMLISDFIWWRLDDNVTLPIERSPHGRVFSFFISFAVYAGFLVVTSIIMGILSKHNLGAKPIESIVSLLATATPVLKDNKILTFISWGVLIPIIETRFFFGRLLEGMVVYGSKVARTIISQSFNLLNWKLWTVVLINAILFAIFHLTAKGMTNSVALMVTAIFAIISCWMVLYFKQTREALIFHVLSNSVAVGYALDIKVLSIVGI